MAEEKKSKRGSVTVEAALAMPLFLFAVLALVYLLEIQAIHLSVSSALQSATKIASEDIATIPVLNPLKLKSDIVQSMGEERLARSIVCGGKAGIHCLGSEYDRNTGIIHAEVQYKVKLPFPGFAQKGMTKKSEVDVRAWTGYEKNGIKSDDDQIVYRTKNGSVYHLDYHCSYLELSIQYVPQTGVGSLRNKDGGKYYPCEHCAKVSSMGGVYITDYGTKYHSSLQCSGLKRTIYAVKKKECAGMGACNKCGQ